MANTDNPFGLRAVRHRNGAPYNGSGSLYHVAASDSQVIAPGDPVVVTGTADTNGVPTVTRATAGDGNLITGVMAGRTNGPVNLNDEGIVFDTTLNTTASTEQYILVHDDPDLVFEAQFAGTLAATDISNNANLSAGVAIEGRSRFEIGAVSALATAQVKILRLVRDVENELGANAKVEVMINQHTQTAGTAGV